MKSRTKGDRLTFSAPERTRPAVPSGKVARPLIERTRGLDSSPVSACPNENRLLEYADGLLAEAEALSVAGHLDGCTSCRGAVAVLAREAEASVSVATPRPATAPLPEQLLRAYLERDAPEREADATRLIAIALLCGIAFIAAAVGILGDGRPPPVPTVAPVLLLAVLLWELGVHTAIHRGHFRPWLPLVDTLIEVSFPFVIGVVSVRAGIAAEADHYPVERAGRSDGGLHRDSCRPEALDHGRSARLAAAGGPPAHRESTSPACR